MIDGIDSKGMLKSTLAYDPSTNKWTEKTPMSIAREHLTFVIVNEKLYVIDGRSEGMSFNVNANEVHDQAIDKWTVLAPCLRKGVFWSLRL